MVAGSDVNEYERLVKEEISLYEQHLPKLPPVVPDPMQRLYVVRVDGVEALQHAGAGFRLMTSCVTDDMMVSLFHVTTDRYHVNNGAEDVLQLAQVLRHVWNMLPLKTRLAWEDAARKLTLAAKPAKEMRKRAVQMKVAYMFLVCSDCGLWLPIRVNYATERLPKAWSFFATVMENHTCKKLVPLLIYMAELMDVPSRDARVLIQFVPSFLRNFPYTCEECKIDAFATPDEMDLHFQEVHHIKYKCTKCGECSGTELYHK
ncbi:hypothetical protein TELCIR_13683 [Teladorsagia circumcincta]|uniref:C2H2-type domain-containing protein n=1 Tax=Teladorsagia circumcincta TaxID=45464 RepID=A0A2G9U324_TELCI|nr:hypothetical protein TELCIR_13683 [Teladorsagia circumcincta]